MSALRFTLIQTDLAWEDKDANLGMLEKKIRGLQETTHIVILPEMFPTGFSMKPEALAEKMDGKVVEWMKRIAAEKKVILTGRSGCCPTALTELMTSATCLPLQKKTTIIPVGSNA